MSMGMLTLYQRALSAIIFIVLLTGGVLSPHVASAATYYVATNGSDANPGTISQPFLTINKGVSVLTSGAGDILYIRQGTYANQPLGYPASATLPSGTSWTNAATISSYPGETATITGSFGITLLYAEHYIIFNGLTLFGSGLFLNCDVHHIRFQNGIMDLNFQGNDHINIISGCGNHLEVLNTKVTRSTGYGIYWFGQDSTFDGLEVYNNCGYGIHMYVDSPKNVNNNIVRNSLIHDNDQGGCPNPGTDFGGFIIGSGSGNQAYNNISYGNHGGLQVDYTCGSCLIYNNTIYGNKGFGMSIGVSTPASVTNTIVKNNIVYSNGTGIVNSGTNSTLSNNLTIDPLFVNATANDFRLQSTSPGIDAGVTLSAVPTDLNRIARPQGARYDIGAYEYQSTFPAPKNLRPTSVVP